jgi:hypothetical protein
MSHETKAIYTSQQRNNLSNVESISFKNVIICTYKMYEQDVLRLHPTICTVYQWRADRSYLAMLNLDKKYTIYKPKTGR